MADTICQALQERGLIDSDTFSALQTERAKVQRNRYMALLLNFYLLRAKDLVVRMEAQGADWQEVATYVHSAKRHYDAQRYVLSWIDFCDLICMAMAKYWPDCDDHFYKRGCEFHAKGKARMARGLALDDGSHPNQNT